MVEVFKTNVQDASMAHNLLTMLSQHFPGSQINFDLEDCDNILRIEGTDFIATHVAELVRKEGFYCELLE